MPLLKVSIPHEKQLPRGKKKTVTTITFLFL